jgi:hypothetical protein
MGATRRLIPHNLESEWKIVGVSREWEWEGVCVRAAVKESTLCACKAMTLRTTSAGTLPPTASHRNRIATHYRYQ